MPQTGPRDTARPSHRNAVWQRSPIPRAPMSRETATLSRARAEGETMTGRRHRSAGLRCHRLAGTAVTLSHIGRNRCLRCHTLAGPRCRGCHTLAGPRCLRCHRLAGTAVTLPHIGRAPLSRLSHIGRARCRGCHTLAGPAVEAVTHWPGPAIEAVAHWPGPLSCCHHCHTFGLRCPGVTTLTWAPVSCPAILPTSCRLLDLLTYMHLVNYFKNG